MSTTTPSGPLMVDYLNGPDVAALALTDDEILTAVEAGLARARPRRDGDRAARCISRRTRRSTVISTCFAATSRRSRSPASRSSAISSTIGGTDSRRRWASSTCSIRAPDGRLRSSTQPASPTCAPVPSRRSARSISRAKNSRVLGHIGARGTAYWNVRLLDRLFRFRRNPRPLAPARKPRRVRGAPFPRPRQAGRRNRRLGILRARRRHRRRGVAPGSAGADAQDGVDRAAARSSYPTAR